MKLHKITNRRRTAHEENFGKFWYWNIFGATSFTQTVPTRDNYLCV